MPWLFPLPALIGLALFVVLPFILAIVLACTDLRLGSPLPVGFVGLEQFRRLLDDPGFMRALVNNALFALVVVPAQTALALALALLLNRRLRGLALYRAAFFLPVVFPLALVAVVWVLLLAPDGLLNAALGALSLGGWRPRDFLHDPAWALPAIMLTSIWQGVGFQMVILLAGLQAIPQSLNEAAACDGAGAWARFRHVTLPQLRPTLSFVMLATAILAFRLFDQVRIMTRGGPLDATTTVMYQAVEAAFSRQQVARGAAMTVVLFVVVLVLAWLQRRWSGR